VRPLYADGGRDGDVLPPDGAEYDRGDEFKVSLVFVRPVLAEGGRFVFGRAVFCEFTDGFAAEPAHAGRSGREEFVAAELFAERLLYVALGRLL
jgi:hypothetical protein